MANKKVTSTSGIRWNDDDRKVLAEINKLSGLTSHSEMARAGIRALRDQLLQQKVTKK